MNLEEKMSAKSVSFLNNRDPKLSLTLFKLGIFFVDYIQLALSTDNFTINRTLFNGRLDLHIVKYVSMCKMLFIIGYQRFALFVSVNDAAPGQIIRRHFNGNFVARQDPDIVHSHFTRNGCQNNVAVFKTNLEISI